MLSLFLLISLTVSVVKCTDGNQRIVCVSELIISGDEDFITSGEDDNSRICCVYGNCSCDSLDHALANLTSNVLIIITTDVTLSSIIKVSNVENVTMIGHNNPTVNCKGFGGIHFTFCHNCIIQGITWDECGTENIDHHIEPGLKLSNSSNITIENCIFQHSKGQAVLLSEVSGDVNINHCNFVHNNRYKGHGAAIHYSSSNVTISHQLSVFTCNFTYNNAKSLVYIENRISKHNNNITFCSAKFVHNQGVSVYAVNQNIYLNGKILFQNNTADRGAGIYVSDHSIVIFREYSNVTFTQNFAEVGGTVFLRNHSNVIFDKNAMVTFNYNVANKGGAIYSEVSSNITFKANCEVTFSHNSAKRGRNVSEGGAIYCNDDSHVIFEGNSSPVFSNNTADDGGGAIFSDSYILFEGNSSPLFSNNTAEEDGGAIFSDSYILFEGNSSPVFSNNTADDGYGGAIFSDSYILFEGNSSPVFSNNTADYHGGAIFSDSYILFKGNSSPVFSNNTADDGGAIFSYSYILFKGNSSPVFDDNTAISHGGAICSTLHINNNISFEGFSAVVFRNNIAEYGGAMFHSDIIFSDNVTIKFTNNKATFGSTMFSNSRSKVMVIGNPTVIFNDLSAKWCNNACLLYTGLAKGDVITIDSNGIVWCSDRRAFICLSKNCYCNKLEDLLGGLKSNTLVNITDTVTLFSVIELDYLNNISIIGYNNITVICSPNGGGLSLYRCKNVSIEGIIWIGCGNNNNLLVIDIFSLFYNIIIQKCTFQYSIGGGIFLRSSAVNINHCNFMNNNNYKDHGAAIYCYDDAYHEITIANCNFNYNGDAKSIIYFDYNYNFNDYHRLHKQNLNLNTCNFHNNQGISVYLSGNITLHISGEVLFENNAAENGAGIYISDHSTVTFNKSSNAKFINNSVDHSGAAIFVTHHSNVIFEENSIVTFNDNKATNGIIYCEDSSNVIFKGTCEITFSCNSATQYGAAIYSSDNSHVTFTENSRVTFSNNVISSNDIDLQNGHGGTIYSENNGCISFEMNSFTVFSNNIADFGAAIFLFSNSNVTFKDSSRVLFTNNIARYCGVLTSVSFSSITYKSNAKVSYDANTISCTSTMYNNHEPSALASAMCTFKRSDVIFSGHSLVTYTNNTGSGGGAIVFSDSNVIIEEYSAVTFNNNIAQSSGGAFTCYNNSNVTIAGNSNVTFDSNKASQDGGAIYSYNMCKITFKGNSTSTFNNNTARNNGGAILGSQLSEIMSEGISKVIFDDNKADYGGAIYYTNSTIIFKETSMVSFYNSKASQDGGAIYSYNMCNITFKGNSTSTFNNNTARNNGGAILNSQLSEITLEGKSTLIFDNNTADNGGAFYFTNSNITIKETSMVSFYNNEAIRDGGAGYLNSHCIFLLEVNAKVTFDNNKAFNGGALCINRMTKFILKGYSTTIFYKNLATDGGGAVKVLKDSSIILKDHITIKFTENSAQYGGAVFLDTTAVMVNNSYENYINFKHNFARILGSSVYQDVVEICNSSCLNNTITGMSNELIATPPNKLKLGDPAICLDDANDTQCNNYYVQNKMLGTEIVLPVCLLDYYNQSVDSIHFLVHETNPNYNYSIKGPKQVLISCDTFEGISIIGNQSLTKPTNFSLNVTLNTALYPNWKQISVNLIIQLLSCHPGFWHYNNSKTCECYNANDIVFCSGGSSTIKRGYWFGSVTGKPTVTFCPINYCNFTCCETSNGYYQLSPIRDNQCRSHRSGTACGNCEEGYTLSFDSVECINVKECSIGQTILVAALIFVYWIVIIAAVFSMMHFKVGIGYLYAITYYYSMVDLLLNQNWYFSGALNTMINVMSSTAKIIPQFLGQFCFIRNMSGIDQQFIHYIHPVAISLFLGIITMLAKRSRRLSSFISKGIIHVICCLLLLSHTSFGTTSLLLMRPLIFHDVDKVYTYVSPDVQYFHGRHLAYVIVAVVFTIVIVIGLPLLLALEPFLNSKINFIKIKPLLDQFQGCYKDKYRCFAAYYMICRLVIITIVIVNSSNDFVFRYLLITACVTMDLIHQLLKPYSNSLLNDFDGTILHFLVLVSVLPLVEFFNNFDTNLFTGITFILLILPLLIFITMSLMINKEKIKKLPGYCYIKCSQLHLRNYSEIPLVEAEDSSDENEYVNIIDDSRRVNATICEV